MNRIMINGFTITSGGSINISNGRIIVDGHDVTPDAKTINIVVHGDVETLSADGVNSLEISGTVAGDVSTQAGDITCGDVKGSVSTMSGDVRCGSIGGNVKTMSGDINHS
jgi:hypothetical protein